MANQTATRPRKIGVPAAPEGGPANTKFAFCGINDPANNPAEVIGDPDIANTLDGRDKATLVTHEF